MRRLEGVWWLSIKVFVQTCLQSEEQEPGWYADLGF
jgi:hypothetical protein